LSWKAGPSGSGEILVRIVARRTIEIAERARAEYPRADETVAKPIA
jgi:hypothetical protein